LLIGVPSANFNREKQSTTSAKKERKAKMRVYLLARFPVVNLILWSFEAVKLLNVVKSPRACADDRYEVYESVVFFANSVEKKLIEGRSLNDAFNLSEKLLEATIKGVIPHNCKMRIVVEVLCQHWTRSEDLRRWYDTQYLAFNQEETQHEFVCHSGVED